MKLTPWCQVVLLALTLAATAFDVQAQAPTKMAISFTATPEFGGIFIAKEEGFFAKRGLDVSLVPIPVAPSVPAAVLSNSVQIGGATPPVLLQAVDSGLDLVGIAGAGVYENASRGVGLVARNGVSISSPADLVGKKVAVPGFNATVHLLMRKWLMDKGVDPKKVTFVEISIPQMPDVLKGGSVDAVAIVEPFMGRILQAQGGILVPGFTNDLASGFSSVLYIATRKWAVANPAQVQAFREAVQEAMDFGNANRDKAYADIGKYFKVPPDVLRAGPWPNWVIKLKDDNLRFWVDTMRSQDMLKKQTVLSSVILP